MTTATYVSNPVDEPTHQVELYRLSEPITFGYDDETTDHVIVSAVSGAFDTGRPETYIFPADSEGNVLGWGELPGSFRGAMDIPRALKDAGWEVTN